MADDTDNHERRADKENSGKAHNPPTNGNDSGKMKGGKYAQREAVEDKTREKVHICIDLNNCNKLCRQVGKAQ